MEDTLLELQETIYLQQREMQRLSDEIYAQQRDMTELRKQITQLERKLSRLEEAPGAIRSQEDETPPPHY